MGQQKRLQYLQLGMEGGGKQKTRLKGSRGYLDEVKHYAERIRSSFILHLMEREHWGYMWPRRLVDKVVMTLEKSLLKLLRRAVSVVIVHNHPSGQSLPVRQIEF